MRYSVALSLAMSVLVAATARAQVFSTKQLMDERLDPSVDYRTLESEHFHIHYPAELEPLAQRLLGKSGPVYSKVTTFMGGGPTGVTHIVVATKSDRPNTFTFVFPQRQIFFDAALPPLSIGLNDYADWHTWLLTHEFTHVVHLEQRRGAFAVFSTFLGSWVRPNLLVPNWLKEGIAVNAETMLTPRGRGHGTLYSMMLRMAENDGLWEKGRFASLDTIGSYDASSWPWGTRPYLMGYELLNTVISTHPRALRRLDASTAKDLPFLLQPAFESAGLGSLEEVWARTLRRVQKRSREELAELSRQKTTPLEYLTSTGYSYFGLEISPNGKWLVATHERPDRDNSIVVMDVGEQTVTAPRELLPRNAGANSSFSGSSRFLVFDRAARAETYLISEMCIFDMKLRSIVSCNDSFRGRDATIHPNGREIAFVSNFQGKNRLLKTTSSWTEPVDLLGDVGYRRISTPRYSPSGNQLAFALHNDVTSGEDLYLLEGDHAQVLVADGAQNRSPSFTPDGRGILYSSDVDGVFNVYLKELETGRVLRLSHVLGGLFEPRVDPQMRWVYALSYRGEGYDVARFPFDPSQSTERVPSLQQEHPIDEWRWDGPLRALEAAEEEPASSQQAIDPQELAPDEPPPPPQVASQPYHGWHYLLPQYALPSLLIRRDTVQAGLRLGAVDPLFLQFYELDLRFDTATRQPVGSFVYFDGRGAWPVDLRLARDTAPVFGATDIYQAATGALAVEIPLFGFGPALLLRPGLEANLVQFHAQTFLAGPTLGFRLDTEFRQNGYTFPEQGVYLDVTAHELVRFPDPLPVTETDLTFRAHLGLPWARHALHLQVEGGAFLTGRSDPNSTFFIGGPESFPFTFNSRFTLFGFPPNSVIAPAVGIGTLRYTLPLWDIQRTSGSVPVFFHRLSVGVVAQAAVTWEGAAAVPRASEGLELFQDLEVGHIFPILLRAGIYTGQGKQRDVADFVFSVVSSW